MNKLDLSKYPEEKHIRIMEDVFFKIIEECKRQKKNEFEIEIDYGGTVKLNNEEQTEVPCTKTWNLKEMKKWIKDRKNGK